MISRRSIPSQPLLDHLGPGSASEHAQRCGVSTRQVVRWRGGSGLMVTTAEDICDRLDLHPTAIWGSDWWAFISCPICTDESCSRCYERFRRAA